jgi:hypothetical protein
MIGRLSSLVIAAALLTAPAASAQEVLSLQAQAVSGGWALPPQGQRAALCLVDSGLDPSQLDVPPGVRLASVPGVLGTGPAIGDNGQPVMHGTWMVQASVAPEDGRGMIGPSPGIPVILVRAMRDRVGYFLGGDYSAGILQCDREARAAGWRLASIALALGGDGVSAEERNSIAQRVESLEAVVVAAVGNRAGVPQFPAGADRVLGITAANATNGERCADSADADPEANGLVGPGCFVTMPVDGQAKPVKSAGTSGAAVVVAAVVAQVCDLRPTLTPRQCLDVVQRTARTVPSGKFPDLRAAAASLGLTAPLVSAPLATLQTTDVPPAGPTASGEVGPPKSVPHWYGSARQPRIVRRRHGSVTITSPDKNGVARMWTNLRGARRSNARSVTGRPRGHTVTVRVTQTVDGLLYRREWVLRVPARG